MKIKLEFLNKKDTGYDEKYRLAPLPPKKNICQTMMQPFRRVQGEICRQADEKITKPLSEVPPTRDPSLGPRALRDRAGLPTRAVTVDYFSLSSSIYRN